MWYFGAHGDRGATGPASGSAALVAYDADGYALLDKIYSGRSSPSAIRIVPVHIADGSGDMRSVGGGAEASLVLLNNSSRAYSVQWIDFQRQSKDYGTLEPMSYRVLSTYLRHAWQLKDTASGRVSRFVVDTLASRWSVDN